MVLPIHFHIMTVICLIVNIFLYKNYLKYFFIASEFNIENSNIELSQKYCLFIIYSIDVDNNIVLMPSSIVQ